MCSVVSYSIFSFAEEINIPCSGFPLSNTFLLFYQKKVRTRQQSFKLRKHVVANLVYALFTQQTSR